jgi:hypothetical protein
MLFIHNDVAARVLDMADVIDVQEDALRQVAEGTAIARPRIDIYAPCDRKDAYWRWGTMEGVSGGYFAIRMKSARIRSGPPHPGKILHGARHLLRLDHVVFDQKR